MESLEQNEMAVRARQQDAVPALGALASKWVAALLGVVLVTAALRADTTYIIKKHDTLTGIARRYGVSVTELARHNGLSLKSTIYPGQRLKIPSRSSSSRSHPALPSSVQQAIDRAPVRSGRWKYIVVHHSGTSAATVKAMDEYHRRERHMVNGIAYHFVIGNGRGMRDGEIAVTHRWTRQLEGGHLHSRSLNLNSIGICLVGDFEKSRPTPKQLASLEALLRALMKRCHLSTSAIKSHQQINPVYTRCPGRYFSLKSLVARLKG